MEEKIIERLKSINNKEAPCSDAEFEFRRLYKVF